MAEETTLDELVQETYDYFQDNGTALDENVILVPDDDAGWARIRIVALQDDGSQQTCGILELAAILEKYGGDVLAAKQEVLDAITDAKNSAVQAISNQQSSSQKAFDTHVAQKQTAFDQHVADKQTDFDENASTKTTTFNQNATTKQESFNSNVTQKTNSAEQAIADAKDAAIGQIQAAMVSITLGESDYEAL